MPSGTCHTGPVQRSDDDVRPHRRDPAWAWYLAAALVVLVMLAAEFSGLLDPLTP
jgi:hypothetical protein